MRGVYFTSGSHGSEDYVSLRVGRHFRSGDETHHSSVLQPVAQLVKPLNWSNLHISKHKNKP
jgi:hypothetical protein